MDKETKIKKLKLYDKDKDFAVFELLLSISDQLALLSKTVEALKDVQACLERMEMKPDKEMVFPEMPKVDFTETNALLKEVAEELKKPWDVKLTLE